METAVKTFHFKDAILDELSEIANVAQFISYSSNLEQRFSRVAGFEPNYTFVSLEMAAENMLKLSAENSVNVRSFDPESPKSREFIYGLTKTDDIVSSVKRLADEGLHTILNETVDINDGGVSGVVLGNVIEFAPEDTPRCVEKPGTASLPKDLGLKLLEKVYHFSPSLNYEITKRVEFSIHPLRRGYRQDHTIIWEIEEVGETKLEADIKWANNFSKFIGDKAYGLLIADLIGLQVPFTTVIPRNLAPFSFGQTTDTGEFWIRTCPTEQMPGKFTTHRGWLDPYKLMREEDSEETQIASILSQEGVDAKYSGSLITESDGEIRIEGIEGFGEDFMQGTALKSVLPKEIESKIVGNYEKAKQALGFVRMEWVYDGVNVWTVQLHTGKTSTKGNIIHPGNPKYFHKFEVEKGIETLRELITQLDKDNGIELIGNIGVTSHLADILRKAEIPSRILNINN